MLRVLQFLVLFLGISYAATTCNSSGLCVSGIQNFKPSTQKAQNWCWAAASEMVLVNQGVNFSQQEALIKVYGTLVDRPANAQQIYQALNGWKITDSKVSSVQAALFNVNDHRNLIEMLDANKPLVVGLTNPQGMIGHAYALTAIYWQRTQMGPIPVGVVLRDPYPTQVSRQEWAWGDFISRLNFAMAVYVQTQMVSQTPTMDAPQGIPETMANPIYNPQMMNPMMVNPALNQMTNPFIAAPPMFFP